MYNSAGNYHRFSDAQFFLIKTWYSHRYDQGIGRQLLRGALQSLQMGLVYPLQSLVQREGRRCCFLEGKVVGAWSMCGATPLLPHTLLQAQRQFYPYLLTFLRCFLDHFHCVWRWMGKIKVFAAYVIKAQRGRRGMAPLIRNLSCIWKLIVDFTLRPKERAPLPTEWESGWSP